MKICNSMICILTDSGRRSTLIRSPSSKPSGTLFCINKGMFRLRRFSAWEPFCHSSSCLRESTNGSTYGERSATQAQNTDQTCRPKDLLTFNKLFDSLRVHRIVVRGRFLPISLILSLFVPAVLHNQRDDELFGLLRTAAEFRERISVTAKVKLNRLKHI